MTWKERCRLVQRIDATLRKDPKNIKWERRWQLKNMDPVARAWLEKNKKAKADWEKEDRAIKALNRKDANISMADIWKVWQT